MTIRAEYDRAAADYDRRWARYNRASLALLRPWIAGRDLGRVVDVACGTGNLLPLIADSAGRVELTVHLRTSGSMSGLGKPGHKATAGSTLLTGSKSLPRVDLPRQAALALIRRLPALASGSFRPPRPMLRSNASFVITPDSFQVSPAITGLPLARPSRRLVAMLLDLFFVALLVELAGGVVLGLAAAYFAFRLASRVTGTGTRPVGRALRLAVRGLGAFILFVVALNLWGEARRTVRRIAGAGVQMSVGSGGDTVRVTPGQAFGLVNEVRALENAESEEEARRRAGELAAGFRRAGMDEEEVRETMEEIAESADQEWMGRAVQRALAAPAAGDSAGPMTPDSLARAYAAAIAEGDTAQADALRPRLASTLARDSLDELRGELRQTREQNQQLEERVERAESRGLVATITGLLDELGLGFGWTGLYFTAFLTMWRGQTPGKRITGVRVVRLNGQPMTLWTSFERFGGYAAGLVTGLLGFAQVYWDRNRQMIHDKIVETVVVRDRGARAAPPAPESAAPPAHAFTPYPSLRRPPAPGE